MMVKLESWSLENIQYPFITITLMSTMTQSVNACQGPINGPTKTIQFFAKDYYQY